MVCNELKMVLFIFVEICIKIVIYAKQTSSRTNQPTNQPNKQTIPDVKINGHEKHLSPSTL